MICPNCYCEPCRCTNHRTLTNGNTGITNYCILCEQSNRKIEKVIQLLKDPNISLHNKHDIALEILENNK